MSKSRLFSGKIKKLSGGNLTVDRYEYLDSSQAEPDLGLPYLDYSVLTGSTSTSIRNWSNILTANTNSVNILSTLSNYGFNAPNALSVSGGVSIGGFLNVAGKAYLNNAEVLTTQSGLTSILGISVINQTLLLTTSTNSISTDTGALIVVGGVGIGADLYVGGSVTVNGALVLTTSSIGNSAVTSITAGTDTVVSTSTGAVTIWNNSTLQSVTNRGHTTTNQINITNITTSTDWLTGALVVAGGVGIGESLNVGGTVYANNFVGGKITVQELDIQLTTITTTLIVTDDIISTYNSTNATSTTTGALKVVGGVGIGGDTWIGGDIYTKGQKVITTATVNQYASQTAIFAGTDTAVNTSTGNVTIWNTSTLQTITSRGATTNNAISITNTSSALSTDSGALQVVGGIGVGSSIYAAGPITSVNGLYSINTFTGSYSDGIVVDYSTGNGRISVGPSDNLTFYNGGPANTSTLVLNSSGVVYVPSSINATSTNSGALQVVGGVGIGGTMVVGGITTITNTTSATSTATGSFQVKGGVGIGGDLYVGGKINISGDATLNGALIITTSSITAYVTPTVITAGTDTAVNTSTGNITIWNTSTLQTITNRGSLTTNAIRISNTTSSTATTNGALVVNGGVGIGGDVNIGGSLSVAGSLIITTSSITTYVTPTVVTAGTDTAVNTSTGNITIWNTSTLQTITNRGSTTTNAVHISNTASSISTITGALVVDGGVGIGGTLNVANTSYIAGFKILTSVDLQTVTHTATYITNNPGSITGLTAIAGTSTVYGTYNFGGVSDIWVFNDFNTGTNTGFYSINDATGAPAHIVYMGFDGVTEFNRIVLNINYTSNSGHTQEIDLYNYTQSQWDTFTTFSGSSGWFEFILGTIDSSPYISSGTVTLRIYHVSSGNTAHRTWIDYVALEKSIQGGQGPRGPTGATGAQGIQGLTTTTTSTFVFSNTLSSTATVTSNAVYIAGGLGIAKSLLVTGEAVFQNNVTFAGTTTFVLSTNTVYTDNIIELHYPNTPGNVWTVNDGKDIGLRFHYYDGTTDQNAGLVLANDTKYLEWYRSGAEDSTSTFSGGVYGTIKTGSLILTNTTASNSTSTGALTVVGGVGIGGDLYLGGALYQNGQQVLSTATINQYANQTAIYAGTDTAVSANSGTSIYIWNTSTLQSVTNRGSTTTNAISISNTTSATNVTTGALTVAGGVGIGGALYVNNSIKVGYDQVVGQSNSTTNGAIVVIGGVGISGNLNVGGSFNATAVSVNGQSVGFGYTGSTGTQGIAGFTGSQGAGFTGSAGYAGSVGYTGSKGSAGADGTSVTIIGSTSTSTIAAFQAIDPVPTRGDGIIVTFNGHLWTYTSATGGASVFGFVDVGVIVGYTGSVGPAGAGYTGSTGTQGSTGFTGSASTATGWTGSRGYVGSQGNFNTAIQVINTQTGTSYTLQLTDAGELISFTNAAQTIVTIPDDGTINFAVGQRIDIEQYGTGPVVISAGVGVLLRSTDSPILNNQYGIGTLIKIGPYEWTFAGPATTQAGFVGSAGVGYVGSAGYTGSRGDFSTAVQVVNTQTGTTYTLVLSDAGEMVNFVNTVSTIVTVPPESSVNFSVGQRIDLTQGNSGPVIISGGSGVTLHYTDSPILTNQYSVGTLIKIGSNEWTFYGPATYAVGYTGSAGTNGITGFTGSTGTQGIAGFTGSASTASGFTGSTGTQGVIGFTGSTGTQGIQGYTGSTGTVGYTGSTGTVGYTGSQGIGYTGSASTASGTFGGGTVTGAATFISTASSTSTTTGAITVVGGVGIGGNLNVGGKIYQNGSAIGSPGNITMYQSGYVTAFVGVQRWYAPYALNITSIKTKVATAASSADVITINVNSVPVTNITIPGAATSGTTYTTPISMNEDDYITVDVSPVTPQTTTATNLYVQFKYVAV